MDTILEIDEAKNREKGIFGTHGTSGGMVYNVNGTFAMGDHIDHIEHAVYNFFNIAPDEVLERLRSTYTQGSPPNESTTTNTIPIISPSLSVAQPHIPSASGPPTNHIAINGFTVTYDPSASATDSLFEIRVIVDIMDALIENPSLRHSVTLPETLACLHRILKLTELAVQVYRDTPLAQTLSLAIIAETKNCRQLLKDLLKNLSDCHYVLSAAMLHYIRQYIWSRTGECSASAGLNSKLRACHNSFAACILALGSFASHELEWGMGTGDLTELHSFSLLVKQESISLQHIRVDTVIVVDHLGRHLPVPTIFCDSRQDFHVVITGFCRDQAGGSRIQRGDYRILSLDDDEVINPTEFHTALQPGMTVGMTIVLREQSQERNSNKEHRCPRCNHINSKVITASGWVSCRKCNGQFQISPESGSIISPHMICILRDGMRENEGIASEILENERLGGLNQETAPERKTTVGYKNIPSLDAITQRLVKARSRIDGSSKPPEAQMNQETAPEMKPVGYKNIPSLDAITQRLAKAKSLSIDRSSKLPEAQMIEYSQTPGASMQSPEHPLQFP
ncbi:hypothetical protein FIBSPDRAFT_937825 [Athelia psychrophila]|uniref:Ubiquitin-like domain-containing protein n=1 Tax=Athelia psychrophila TaxID=1759441 RepID=A0A165ZSV7_9AGAM|nr:hypothetical protein FIBSPDRAFT_937825 [Fibularhizoctonia sp. CBS 109695]